MGDKYKREIEELLERLEKTDRFVDRQPPRRRAPARQSWFHRLDRHLRGLKIQFSPGWLMVAAVGLILISLFLRPVVHGLAGPLGLLGVLLFFAAYLLGFRGRNSYPAEKRWRGRIIELPKRNSWRYKLSRWLRSRR